MNLLKIGNAFYNLDYLVKYVERVGQREAGTVEADPLRPRPAFDEFRFFELFFVDGSRVALDDAQTEAFRRAFAGESTIDLGREDEEAWGSVLVHDAEAGDVIVSREALERDEITEEVLARDAAAVDPFVPPVVVDRNDQTLPGPSPRRRSLGGSGLFGPGPGSITQDGM